MLRAASARVIFSQFHMRAHCFQRICVNPHQNANEKYSCYEIANLNGDNAGKQSLATNCLNKSFKIHLIPMKKNSF